MNDIVARFMFWRIKLSLVTLLAAIVGTTFAADAQSQDVSELRLGTQTNSVSWFPLYVAMLPTIFPSIDKFS